MRYLLLILMVSYTFFAQAQDYSYHYKNPQDSSVNCYLKVYPKQKVKGLIVRDYSRLPNASKKSPYQFLELATAEGYLTLYTCTSSFYPELFYTDAPMQRLDSIIYEVVQTEKLAGLPIFLGGISASGTRALRYAQFCAQGKSIFKPNICGVFAVDSPLDLARFYKSSAKNGAKFIGGMAEEAPLILKQFPAVLGATAYENPQAYYQASVYAHENEAASAAKLLVKTPLLLFTEPDINWWLQERHATYYDINAFDYANFTNYLKLLGHKDLTLITTTGKGYNRQGQRKPHSWSIVDEQLLLDWIKAHS